MQLGKAFRPWCAILKHVEGKAIRFPPLFLAATPQLLSK